MLVFTMKTLNTHFIAGPTFLTTKKVTIQLVLKKTLRKIRDSMMRKLGWRTRFYGCETTIIVKNVAASCSNQPI